MLCVDFPTQGNFKFLFLYVVAFKGFNTFVGIFTMHNRAKVSSSPPLRAQQMNVAKIKILPNYWRM
jgi:hypothetical protein